MESLIPAKGPESPLMAQFRSSYDKQEASPFFTKLPREIRDLISEQVFLRGTVKFEKEVFDQSLERKDWYMLDKSKNPPPRLVKPPKNTASAAWDLPEKVYIPPPQLVKSQPIIALLQTCRRAYIEEGHLNVPEDFNVYIMSDKHEESYWARGGGSRKCHNRAHLYHVHHGDIANYDNWPYAPMKALPWSVNSLKELQMTRINIPHYSPGHWVHQWEADQHELVREWYSRDMQEFAYCIAKFVALEELILDFGTTTPLENSLEQIIQLLETHTFYLNNGRVLEVDQESVRDHNWIERRNGSDGREIIPGIHSRGIRWVSEKAFNKLYESQKACLLLTRLPKTILARIYALALTPSIKIDLDHAPHIQRDSISSSLLRTCRWIYRDAYSIFWSPKQERHSMVAPCKPYTIPLPMHKAKPFSQLTYKELEEIRKVHLFARLCHVCFQTGLHLRAFLFNPQYAHIRSITLHWYEEPHGREYRKSCRQADDWINVKRKDALWDLRNFGELRELIIVLSTRENSGKKSAKKSGKNSGTDMDKVVALASTWEFLIGGDKVLQIDRKSVDDKEWYAKQEKNFTVVQETEAAWVSRGLRWTIPLS